jgi:electron transfer flavoprotein alpha subunit
MAGAAASSGLIWVVAETNADGSLARSSTEVATLARTLAEAAGTEAAGIVVAADPKAAAAELAGYVSRVVAIAEPKADGHAWAQVAAQRVAAALAGETPGAVLTGAGPDGRDVAGTLSALLEKAVLVNATAVAWDGGPSVEMSVFGGKLVTTSAFVEGEWGIVTVRPNVVTAEKAAGAGKVESAAPEGDLELPLVKVVERIEEAAAALPIEEARIIVAGGRGVGGEEGFQLVRDIAEALGGAVGATRAAVDSGWIPYAQQIGQTGKIVKPQLYLALGISGAIQHKVGMQTAGTIIGVNRDPDAPIAEFADLVVVGDLFEVGKALLAELKARG